MNDEDRDDKLADRRNAILTALLGLPSCEATALLAETICASLYVEKIEPRSAEYINFEATLTHMISGRLETMKAMEGESEKDLSADAEPDALDLNRAYKQMIKPLFVLTHEKALDLLIEAIARILYDRGVRGDDEEIVRYEQSLGDSICSILEQLDAESDPEVERAVAEREKSDVTVH